MVLKLMQFEFLETQMWNPEIAYWSLQFFKYSVGRIFLK